MKTYTPWGPIYRVYLWLIYTAPCNGILFGLKRNTVLIHATTLMNIENTELKERS